MKSTHSKKQDTFARFSSLLVASSLLVPSVPFAMDLVKEDFSKNNTLKRSNDHIRPAA
jgi:hypothetical protein